MKRFTPRRRHGITAAAIAGALFLGMGGFAAAQWILNTGLGNVTTEVNPLAITLSAPTGSALTPGGTTQSITVTIRNASATTQQVSFTALESTAFTGTCTGCADTINLGTGIAADWNGQGGTGATGGSGGVYDTLTSAYVDACSAVNFALSNFTAGVGTNGTQLTTSGNTTIAVGKTVIYSFTVGLLSSAPIGCANLAPQVVVAS